MRLWYYFPNLDYGNCMRQMSQFLQRRQWQRGEEEEREEWWKTDKWRDQDLYLKEISMVRPEHQATASWLYLDLFEQPVKMMSQVREIWNRLKIIQYKKDYWCLAVAISWVCLTQNAWNQKSSRVDFKKWNIYTHISYKFVYACFLYVCMYVCTLGVETEPKNKTDLFYIHLLHIAWW